MSWYEPVFMIALNLSGIALKGLSSLEAAAVIKTVTDGNEQSSGSAFIRASKCKQVRDAAWKRRRRKRTTALAVEVEEAEEGKTEC